jgi:hypothetical protein
VQDIARSDELREALHDLIIRLYPDGPTDNALWERAGGQDADVPDASTGRLRWGMALDAAVRGQRGAPKIKALIDAMTEDYPNNPELAILAKAIRRKRK